MHKAFISYTRTKDEFGSVGNLQKRLVNELRNYEPGAMVFQDKQDLQAGDYFNDEIKSQLRDSDLLIVLLSPAWLQRDYCRLEYETFVEKEEELKIRPRLLPVLWVKEKEDLYTDQTSEFAKELLKINYVDFYSFRNKQIEDPEYADKIAEIARQAQNLAARTGES